MLLPAFFLVSLQAQQTIRLQNPSFEWDEREAGLTPGGWMNMGAENETPSDIQPGWFGVKLEAQDGDKFVGMVVRDNNTWEGIGQKLNGWLNPKIENLCSRQSFYSSRAPFREVLQRSRRP